MVLFSGARPSGSAAQDAQQEGQALAHLGLALALFSEDRKAQAVQKQVGSGVLFVTLFAWGIVGFLFWIPMIARAIAVLSAATVYATMNHLGESYLAPAKAQLSAAVTFWSRGFAMLRTDPANVAAPPEPGTLTPFRMGRVVVEVATTIIFWFGFSIIIAIGKSILSGRS